MTINTKHKIGDIVYLVTDPDQHARMITCISIRYPDRITYEVSFGMQTSWHADIEVCHEKDVLKSIT